MSTAAQRKQFLDKLSGCKHCAAFRLKYIDLYKSGALTKRGRMLVKEVLKHDTDDAWTWFANEQVYGGNIRKCPVHDKKAK